MNTPSEMSPLHPYRFEARIERFAVGRTRKVWYNVLFLPDEIESELPFERYPRLRVEGEIADVPIANAFMPTGDGRYYVIVGSNVLKDADVGVGDEVEMRFRIADQDYVEVPNVLREAVNGTTRTADAWNALTPGKRRMLSQHVLSAKTTPTRNRRAAEAIEALVGHGGDLRAWRNARRKKAT